MAVDRALEGVLALLQGDGEGRRLPVLDDRRLLARDREVVLEHALVDELEDHGPVRRALARELELVLGARDRDRRLRLSGRTRARERRQGKEGNGRRGADARQDEKALHNSPFVADPERSHDTSLRRPSPGSSGTSSTSSRSIREPSTSRTLKRQPSAATSSPGSGARPSRPKTKPP